MLAAEAKNKAHLLLRVHRARGVVWVREHQHLHLLALGLRLLEGILQDLLGNDVVVLRRVRTDQRTSVAQGEVVVEGIVARSDAYPSPRLSKHTDEGIVGIEQRRTHNIHHSSRTINGNDRIRSHRHLEHLRGQEMCHTLLEVLTPIVGRRVPSH